MSDESSTYLIPRLLQQLLCRFSKVSSDDDLFLLCLRLRRVGVTHGRIVFGDLSGVEPEYGCLAQAQERCCEIPAAMHS